MIHLMTQRPFLLFIIVICVYHFTFVSGLSGYLPIHPRTFIRAKHTRATLAAGLPLTDIDSIGNTSSKEENEIEAQQDVNLNEEAKHQ
jgi:hypothetical protein